MVFRHIITEEIGPADLAKASRKALRGELVEGLQLDKSSMLISTQGTKLTIANTAAIPTVRGRINSFVDDSALDTEDGLKVFRLDLIPGKEAITKYDLGGKPSFLRGGRDTPFYLEYGAQGRNGLHTVTFADEYRTHTRTEQPTKPKDPWEAYTRKLLEHFKESFE